MLQDPFVEKNSFFVHVPWALAMLIEVPHRYRYPNLHNYIHAVIVHTQLCINIPGMCMHLNDF